jgi:pyrimidine operon attenuation protein/uracil phosphoribosyltransferase
MGGELGTTNLLLGIMAAVSVLEALAIIGLAIGGFVIYRRVSTLIEELEQRQVAPAMARVNAILDDLKHVSAKVKEDTAQVDHAIRTTLERVDDTADRVRSNVRAKTSRIVGIIRGARVAIESMLAQTT